MGRAKANDETFFKSTKKRFFKIELKTMDSRADLKFTFTCPDCSNNLPVVGYYEMSKIQKHAGLCNDCYEKLERTRDINLIGSTNIKNFLDSIFKKNLDFFKKNSLVYEKLIPIFHRSKISKKDFSLIFNIWFETTFTARKISDYCKIFNYHFFINDDNVRDAQGNEYYPLEGFKRHKGRHNLKTTPMDKCLNTEVIFKPSNPDDFFTITEIVDETSDPKQQLLLDSLSIFLKDESFINLLQEKMSNILAERYSETILKNDGII